MNTETKGYKRRIRILPLLMALPFLAAVVFAALRFGPTLLRIINVAIKAAVAS